MGDHPPFAPTFAQVQHGRAGQIRRQGRARRRRRDIILRKMFRRRSPNPRMSPTFAAGPRKLLSWNTGLPAINLLALAARSGLSINRKADVAFTSKAKNDAAPRFSVGPSIYRGCSCTCQAHPSETESMIPGESSGNFLPKELRGNRAI